MRIKRKVFLAILTLALLPMHFSQFTAATALHKANVVYLFVEIETKASRKDVPISSEHPSERRWYISNVVVQPTTR